MIKLTFANGEESPQIDFSHAPDVVKKRLKEFFATEQAQRLLSINNFNGLYHAWDVYQSDWSASAVTDVLFASGVDFLSYLSFVPSNFIEGHALMAVEMDNKIRNIDKGAFKYNNFLSYVKIPNSILSIGSTAFGGCYNLKELVFDGTQSEWFNIKKDRGWSIGSSIKKIICINGEIDGWKM